MSFFLNHNWLQHNSANQTVKKVKKRVLFEFPGRFQDESQNYEGQSDYHCNWSFTFTCNIQFPPKLILSRNF